MVLQYMDDRGFSVIQKQLIGITLDNVGSSKIVNYHQYLLLAMGMCIIMKIGINMKKSGKTKATIGITKEKPPRKVNRKNLWKRVARKRACLKQAQEKTLKRREELDHAKALKESLSSEDAEEEMVHALRARSALS